MPERAGQELGFANASCPAMFGIRRRASRENVHDGLAYAAFPATFTARRQASEEVAYDVLAGADGALPMPFAVRRAKKLRMMTLPTPMGLANADGLAKADDLTDDDGLADVASPAPMLLFRCPSPPGKQGSCTCWPCQRRSPTIFEIYDPSPPVLTKPMVALVLRSFCPRHFRCFYPLQCQ